MTKKEFLKRMDEARKLLSENKIRGVCSCLAYVFSNYRVPHLFEDYLRRGICAFFLEYEHGYSSFPLSKEETFQRRIIALCFFKEICLTEKYYKEF